MKISVCKFMFISPLPSQLSDYNIFVFVSIVLILCISSVKMFKSNPNGVRFQQNLRCFEQK